MTIFFHTCHYGHIWGIWAHGHMGICEKIWSSGVSPKKASKMQLRNVDLRSVGHSSQKLWPKTFFGKKCLVFCLISLKKIRSTFSRLVRDLVQKAKCSKIFRRSRIQAVPTLSNNLCPSVIILYLRRII